MAENGITMTNMPEFRAVMREYREVSRREDGEIVDTKAFFIARGAAQITHRADKNLIEIELQQLTKAGKKNILVGRYGRRGQYYEVPLAALLINAERGAKGKPGLQGAAMRRAVVGFIGSRKRSAAFIASGWIPAIKAFAPRATNKAGAPAVDSEIRQYGQAKGSGTPSRDGDAVPKAILANFAQAAGKTGEKALSRFALAGLQRAFLDEIKSMRSYIAQKKQATADKFNAH